MVLGEGEVRVIDSPHPTRYFRHPLLDNVS